MDKKIRFLMLLICLLLICYQAFGDIGENFESAGYSLGGGLSFHYDAGEIFDEEDEYSYLSLSINPRIGFFLVDNLDFSISPNLYYSRYNETGYIRAGIGFGSDFFLVENPDVETGIVPSFGIDVSLNLRSSEGKSLSMDIDFGPDFRLYYFLKERVAPYIGIFPNISLRRGIRDYEGDPVEHDESFYKDLDFSVMVGVGITFFLPNEDIVILPNP